jgi:hypothetical protein
MGQTKTCVIRGLAIFVALLGVPTIAGAHGGDTTMIHTCVNNNSGSVKFIAADGSCHNNETPVDWDKAARTTPGTFTVDCDAGQTIQDTIKDLIAGDTLLVSGTCDENVLISGATAPNSLTLDGQGTATINGPNTTQATIRITRGGITIKGFTITGGRDGIDVSRGGTATITGNVIGTTSSGPARDGIVLTRWFCVGWPELFAVAARMLSVPSNLL